MLAIDQADLGFDPARVRPVDDAARLTQPLLAIVGTADTTVSPAQGIAMFHAAAGPSSF